MQGAHAKRQRVVRGWIRGGDVHEVDADAADEIVACSVFIKHFNLQPVIAFNYIKVVLFVPNGRLAAAIVSFASPGAADVKS
jgi:hypothetical protein